MNMKKTLASVMAGAMAVSAMATVVSADQDAISLTYDLKTYVKDNNSTKAKITLTANYEKVTFGASDATKLTFSSENGYTKAGNTYGSELKATEFGAKPYKNYVGSSVTSDEYQVVKISKENKAEGDFVQGNPSEIAFVKTSEQKTSTNFNLAGYDLSTLGYSVEENAKSEGLSGAVTAETYGFSKAYAKLTYEIPNSVKLDNSNRWDGNSASTILGFMGEKDIKTDVTMTAEIFNKASNGKDVVTKVGTKELNAASITITSFEAGQAAEKVYPFKTTLNPKNKENDVVAALTSYKSGENLYTKPIAVLNDAIANHDNVVFTFTSYNGYVATAKSNAYMQWVEEGRAYGYQATPYDWYNPTFSQHLYANLNDAYSNFDSDEYDQYGSYSSAWGINLFTGAVVVNSGLTMQLSDTDTFNWGSNTLSFDWFDITDEGKITDAKTFLTSMLLYTPTDWYWDTLTVVVSDDEDEAIDAGEGLDGEGDTIDDEEPADEEIVEEPEVEETEAPAETEAAPVETAPSPATGNAPVALAVIPVALAAAAVVAKKRG